MFILRLTFALLNIMFLRFIHVDTCRSNDLFDLHNIPFLDCIIILYLSTSLMMGICTVIISNTALVFLCAWMRISPEDIPRGRTAMLLDMHICNLIRYQQLAFQRIFVFINLQEYFSLWILILYYFMYCKYPLSCGLYFNFIFVIAQMLLISVWSNYSVLLFFIMFCILEITTYIEAIVILYIFLLFFYFLFFL